MPDAATAHPHRTPRGLLKRTLLLLALGIATTIIVAASLSALVSHWAPDRIPSRVTINARNDDLIRSFVAWPQQWPGAAAFSWSPGPQYLTGVVGNRITRGESDLSIDNLAIPPWSCIRDETTRNNALSLKAPITLHADWIAGWPLPALRGRLTPASLTDTQRIQLREGMLRFRDSTARISIGDGLWLSGHLFPLIPMPGFLINTVVYAAAWAALLAGISTIQRTRRHRRGQCPACKYDLRNTPPNAPCPECGRTR